jgi:hypothetical protein
MTLWFCSAFHSIKIPTGPLHMGIDRPPGAHDDLANAAAGALVTAFKEPGISNFHRKLVYPFEGCATILQKRIQERGRKQWTQNQGGLGPMQISVPLGHG